jgi:hypothetical protein
MKILQHSFLANSLDVISRVVESEDMGFGSNVWGFENIFIMGKYHVLPNTEKLHPQIVNLPLQILENNGY